MSMSEKFRVLFNSLSPESQEKATSYLEYLADTENKKPPAGEGGGMAKVTIGFAGKVETWFLTMSDEAFQALEEMLDENCFMYLRE